MLGNVDITRLPDGGKGILKAATVRDPAPPLRSPNSGPKLDQESGKLLLTDSSNWGGKWTQNRTQRMQFSGTKTDTKE